MFAGLLWGLLALGGDPVSRPFPAATDTLIGPGRELPFVAQTPLLCGGAAAAMVLRHHGMRGVYGDDFAHLVRPDDGGIWTSDLVEELRDRGIRTRVSRATPDAARAALEAGLAPILLLDAGGPTLHYVVLVGMDAGRAWYHDPNWGPNRSLPLDELHRRWGDADFWMATVYGVPDTPAIRTEQGPDPSESSTASVPPAAEAAMRLLREGAFRAARDRVASLTESEAGSELAWRITATSHYLEGDEVEALRAWNHLGEPRLDLVGIDGLRATRYHTVRRRIGVPDGAILRPRDLRLARRHVDQLPSIRAARVSIRPVANGDAEMTVSVLEHRRWPGPVDGVAALGTSLVRDEVEVEVGPLFGASDRWRLAGGWHEARNRVAFQASMPASPIPGVVRAGAEWRRESFTARSEPEERIRGEVGITEWVTPEIRVGAVGGFERWTDGERRASLGLMLGWMGWADRVHVDLELDGWTGREDETGRVRAVARLRVPAGDGREVRARVGGTSVSSSSSPLLWDGAGIGPFREIPLRAHSIESDGALGGPTLAPRIAHAGLEFRFFRRVGPGRLTGFLFADGAVSSGAIDGTGSSAFLDGGFGIALDLDATEAQVTLGYGEPGWKISARLIRYRPWQD